LTLTVKASKLRIFLVRYVRKAVKAV